MKYLEYIGSSGSQFINTGIYPRGTTRVKMTCRIRQATSNWDTLFGTRNGSAARFTLRYSNSTRGELQMQYSYRPSASYAGYNTGIVKNGEGLNWHEFEQRGNLFFVDGVQKQAFTSGTDDTFPFALFLFALNNAGTASDFSYMEMGHCEIRDGSGTLLRDFSPAMDDNDVVCLYDAVSETYFYNGGSGSFTAGPEVHVYVPSGTLELALTDCRAVTDLTGSAVSWQQSTPENTSVTVEAKLDGGIYAAVTNGGALPIAAGTDLSQRTLYIRITLQTSVLTETPSLQNLRVVMADSALPNKLELSFASGSVNSFRNAYGDITLTYDGAGGLEGEGGAVEAFEETFAPVGLVPKPNQNDAEHIELSLTAVGTLTRIYYTDTQEREHISLDVSASGVLTHVDDL